MTYARKTRQMTLSIVLYNNSILSLISTLRISSLINIKELKKDFDAGVVISKLMFGELIDTALAQYDRIAELETCLDATKLELSAVNSVAKYSSEEPVVANEHNCAD